MKIINRVVTKNIDPSDYVHKDTGEMLVPNENTSYKVSKIKVTNSFIADSKHYITIDMDSIMQLEGLIPYQDFGALFCICENLSKEFNILMYNNHTPHTTNTISDKLRISNEGARILLKRLVDKSILAYVVSVKSGYKQKIYIANPSIIRKSKSFSNELKLIFDDLTGKKAFK